MNNAQALSNLGNTVCTAFDGTRIVAQGTLNEVATHIKGIIGEGVWTSTLIFDDIDAELIDVDYRGSVDDVLCRISERPAKHAIQTEESQENTKPTGPGRPKLGVVGREITLLPRHWEWLDRQSGGASVALRKLVEQARKANADKERADMAKTAANRFLFTVAGNFPGLEETTRALFAGDKVGFLKQTEPWPEDVRNFALRLAASAFEPATSA